MSAKQSVAAAGLLIGFSVSFSWAQTSNAQFCEALDITTENCPTFSTSSDSSTGWFTVEDSDARGGTALRSGVIGNNQRSCLSATLNRPVRVAFRWRVSSRAARHHLHYIDDGRRDPSTHPTNPTDDKYLSGEVAWKDGFFEYLGSGEVDVEWCYIKIGGDNGLGTDAGFLDQLQITELFANIAVSPSQVFLPEGSSETLTLSLLENPPSNVTVNLTVPEEAADDIAFSPAQVVFSPGKFTAPITITAKKDDTMEARETHVAQTESLVALSAEITVIILPDIPPQDDLCSALDITESCPTFSVSDDSQATWSVIADSDAEGGMALRSGVITHSQRSCLGATLQRQGPVRVAFRWRVSSERLDRLHYIDDGQRNPALSGFATGARFLSGKVAWRDASFEYPGSDSVNIEWCYIKDANADVGDDAGYLDKLQIIPLSDITVTPSQVLLSEGESEMLTLSLAKAPQSNVTVNLTVPEESMDDITISSTQVVFTPSKFTTPITISVIRDDNVEAGETHLVRVQGFALSTIITVMTPPEPLPQDQLCAALDISEEDCPKFTFATSDDSSASWSASAVSGATASTALRSGVITHSQRSCLGATLQRQGPVRVAFRWRVSSESSEKREPDYLHYIDDGQRNPVTGGVATGARFLSGEVAWQDAFFDYSGGDPVDIEWCYIKNMFGRRGQDAGYLDELQITPLPDGSITVSPSQVLLSEGSSATFTLSLDEVPESSVTVNLTVPAESTDDITISSTQVVLSSGQLTAPITIRVKKDNNAEARETHSVRVQSPTAISTIITIITPPDPLPQDSLCEALDISEEDCPAFSTSDDSSAAWFVVADSGATASTALRSGMIGNSQRSCLSATLQRPVSVAFRWRAGSQERADYLRYIDDGQRNPVTEDIATGARFLSGNAAWQDASFDYFGGGSVDIEWCYIKGRSGVDNEDAGFLDRLQINPPNIIIITPSQVQLSEGSSATLTLSLAETPQSHVTIKLTVPTESAGDITVSPAQLVLSPSQLTAPITISSRKDGKVELRETHSVNAQSPVAAAAVITVITPPDPLPQDSLCKALDIGEEGCPTFSNSDDSSAIWSASTDSGSTGGTALRNEAIDHNQRSCLSATLQRPVRVAFRWRVSSQEGADYLRYIDDGQRNPAQPAVATGDRFLSGDVAWRDAFFDHTGNGPVDVEWCYIKDGSDSAGDDAGFLDRLQITPLSDGSIIVSPAQALLPEGGSSTFTLSLNKAPQSNVTISLTVREESINDITVSSTQVVLSPSQSTMPITITASEDDNVESGETHVVQAQSPVAAATIITIITPPDPLPQDSLCEALDISEEDCPAFSTSDDSSAIWSASTDSGATGDTALRSGMIDDDQRSCLRATLQRPVLVAFRWRVSSQERADYLRYIDDGQRNPVTGSAATGDKFLSGNVAWQDASFDYFGNGPIDIEWCYIKDGSGSAEVDAGFLDQLQINPPNSIIITPPQAQLSEGGSSTFTLSLDKAPQSNVTISLTVREESINDITISSAQVVLSPSQSTMPITITASEDGKAEARETHHVDAQSPVAAATVITIITPSELVSQNLLCAALDIREEACPTFSAGDGSSAIWSVITDSNAAGGTALRNEAIDHNQRSCLSATLQRPVRVAFRWRVSSQEGADYLRYIDDGQRNPAQPATATGDKLLSGDVAWRDASFDYAGNGFVDIEWCYIKDGSGSAGDDAGFLDRLQISPPSSSINLKVRVYLEGALQ